MNKEEVVKKSFAKLFKAEQRYLIERGWVLVDKKKNKWKAPEFTDLDGCSFRYYNAIFPGDVIFQKDAVVAQREFDLEECKAAAK